MDPSRKMAETILFEAQLRDPSARTEYLQRRLTEYIDRATKAEDALEIERKYVVHGKPQINLGSALAESVETLRHVAELAEPQSAPAALAFLEKWGLRK